jgi:hypothetical protein
MRIRSVCLVSASTWTVVAVLSGCVGRDPLGRHPISGTVTFGGAPVDNGNISFQPIDGGVTSSGAPIQGGKFSIDKKDGLPAGKYRVVINAPKPGTGGKVDPNALPGDPVEAPVELIPPEWNMQSKESIEVKPEGPFEFKFDIPAKK